jgi:predicted peroxiredoxin
MKTLAFTMLLPALMLFSCQSAEKPSSGEEAPGKELTVARDGIFIHLSCGPEDAHRALMALKMAEVMSTDKDVLMYLDIQAVHLVVKDAPDVSMEGFTSSLQEIRSLLDHGVIIQVCPTCLKVAGYSGSDLVDGVVLANKEKFFTFTQGKILSIDY